MFDKNFKKLIPLFPKNIGVITSPSGAVIMDIIDRVESRFPSSIKLYPVSVQGANAVKEIVSGIKFFSENPVDVLIIARGGGGTEDLMPFNDEELVREVFKCKIPIISAIGHETDFTLLDFVADIRAATPTAAAELAVQEIKSLKEKINFIEKNLKQIVYNFIINNKKFLKNINTIFNIKSLSKLILNHNKNLSILIKSMNSNYGLLLKLKNANLIRLNSIIKNLDVKNVLKRCFALIKDQNKKFVKNTNILKKNKNFYIEFYEEEITAEIKLKNERS